MLTEAHTNINRKFSIPKTTPSNAPNIAEVLLHHPDCLKVCRMVEGITPEQEKLDEVACDVSTRHIQPACEMRKSKTLIHRADVRHSITTVYHNACQQTCIPTGGRGGRHHTHIKDVYTETCSMTPHHQCKLIHTEIPTQQYHIW